MREELSSGLESGSADRGSWTVRASAKLAKGQANERPWPRPLFVQRASAYQDVTVAEQETEDAGNLQASSEGG